MRLPGRVLAFLMAVSLAGCSTGGGDDGGDGPSGGDGPDDPLPAGAVHGPNPKGNRPPTANLAVEPPAQAGGTFVFTVNGHDSDGDPLTWLLAFGDGSASFSGTDLPTKVSHTFAPGSYTANLTVSDGKVSTWAVLAVRAEPAAASQVVDGSYAFGGEGCAAAAYDQAGVDGGSAAGGATNDVTRVQFEVAPASVGRPFTAAFTFDTGYLYVSVDFFDAGGVMLSSDNTGQSPNFGDLTLSGTVPEGAAKGVLFACGGPASATVHYEAA
jgi:PKD repeat protein